MANRNFTSQRNYNFHVMPVQVDMSCSIGASGVPTIEDGSGLGIKSITKMADGQYRIRLEDNYKKLLMVDARMQSPVTGAAVAATALVPGTVYQITSMGTTTQAQWVTAGVPSGITAAVGVVFKAAATSSGTGAGKALGASGIATIEVIGNSENQLNSQPFTSQNGGYVDIQTLGPTAGGDTALIAKDPADGSKLFISIKLSNSSIQ